MLIHLGEAEDRKFDLCHAIARLQSSTQGIEVCYAFRQFESPNFLDLHYKSMRKSFGRRS